MVLKSMVVTPAPRWKPTLSQPYLRQMIPLQMCSPECCCMWSKRRAQSMTPPAVQPGVRGAPQVWKITPPRSWTSSTGTPPSVPWSAGCPPPSG